MTEKMNIQEKCGDLVAREVYCNVDSLVRFSIAASYEGASFGNDDPPVTYEDIENGRPDFYGMTKKELKRYIVDEIGYEKETVKGMDQDELVDFCNDNYIEPEIYEYWAVSNWLGVKLKDQGEIVIDAYPTIWGRCTTGQAILLDSVIVKIVKNLHGDENF